MTIAISATGPALATASSAAGVTTASFTPAANTLLVLMATALNGTGNAGLPVGTVTDSIGSTWTLRVRQNNTGGADAEIWIANVTNSPSARTITFTPTVSTAGAMVAVLVLTGAANVAGQTGAIASLAATNNYSIPITTTTAGSLPVIAVARGYSNENFTTLANSTSAGVFNDAADGASAGAARGPLTVTPGAVTIGFSNTPAAANQIAAAEILAGTAPPSAVLTAPMVLTSAGVTSPTVSAAAVMAGSSTFAAASPIDIQLAASPLSATGQMVTNPIVLGTISLAGALTATAVLAALASRDTPLAAVLTASGFLNAQGLADAPMTATAVFLTSLLNISPSASVLLATALIAGEPKIVIDPFGLIGLGVLAENSRGIYFQTVNLRALAMLRLLFISSYVASTAQINIEPIGRAALTVRLGSAVVTR